MFVSASPIRSSAGARISRILGEADAEAAGGAHARVRSGRDDYPGPLLQTTRKRQVGQVERTHRREDVGGSLRLCHVHEVESR